MPDEMKILREMFDHQLLFQSNAIPNWNRMQEDERVTLTRDFCMYMVGEMVELLKEMDWKTHRREVAKIKSRQNVLEELIDIFKYWMTVFIMHGFTPEDLVKEFYRKSFVVHQKWRQEHFQWDPDKLVVVDVDGTLADYYRGLCVFLHHKTGIDIDPEFQFETCDLTLEISRLLKIPMSGAIKFKHEFREQGWKQNLKVLPGAREFLSAIRGLGAQIMLLTSRPYHLYKRMFADTILWMDKNDLHYDALWTAEDKRDFLLKAFPSVVMVVDDDPNVATRLASAGYSVKMPPYRYNRHVRDHDGVEEITLQNLAAKVIAGGLRQ